MLARDKRIQLFGQKGPTWPREDAGSRERAELRICSVLLLGMHAHIETTNIGVGGLSFTRAPNPGTCYIYLQWGFLLNAHWIVMDRDGYWTDSEDTGHVACKRHGWSDTGRKMKNGYGRENALTCWFVPFTTFQCQCLKCPLVDFWMSQL